MDIVELKRNPIVYRQLLKHCFVVVMMVLILGGCSTMPCNVSSLSAVLEKASLSAAQKEIEVALDFASSEAILGVSVHSVNIEYGLTSDLEAGFDGDIEVTNGLSDSMRVPSAMLIPHSQNVFSPMIAGGSRRGLGRKYIYRADLAGWDLHDFNSNISDHAILFSCRVRVLLKIWYQTDDGWNEILHTVYTNILSLNVDSF